MKKHRKIIKHKSTFRKINDWLHLWLGLASGIVIFIVSITGCLYAFQKEIKDAMEPWRFVQEKDSPLAPPSLLLMNAEKEFPDKKPTGLTYGHKNEAAAVGFQSMKNGKMEFSVVFMNPYNGAVIRKSTLGKDFDFFRFVMDGHRALWLPYGIGRPIVGVATLIFLFLVISGLIMWWPKKWKKNHLKQAFMIKFHAKAKRLNYDLHNVLGFYSFLVAAVIAVTGLVWSFGWFSDGLHFLASGGSHRKETEISKPSVPIEHYKTSRSSRLDEAWRKVIDDTGNARGGMFMTPVPADKSSPIEITVYNRPGKFYDKSDYIFDQFTLKKSFVKKSYHNAEFAEKLTMLNYDIHTGQVWGWPGKILAFMVSFICASLPFTGLFIWLNRKKKTKRDHPSERGHK